MSDFFFCKIIKLIFCIGKFQEYVIKLVVVLVCQSCVGCLCVWYDDLVDIVFLVLEGEVGEDIIVCIYQIVFDSVMSQCFIFGIKLLEVVLCELFGVGCMVVQKVLQKLVYEYIVELWFNCGVVVVMLILEEMCEIFEVWCVLEGVIMWLVVCNVMCVDLVKLCCQLKEEYQVMYSYVQIYWVCLVLFFYMWVVELLCNVMLQCYLGELVLCCLLIVVLYELVGYVVCEYDEYMYIVDLIECGDSEGVVVVMEVYLVLLEEYIYLVSEKSGNSLVWMLGME